MTLIVAGLLFVQSLESKVVGAWVYGPDGITFKLDPAKKNSRDAAMGVNQARMWGRAFASARLEFKKDHTFTLYGVNSKPTQGTWSISGNLVRIRYVKTEDPFTAILSKDGKSMVSRRKGIAGEMVAELRKTR